MKAIALVFAALAAGCGGHQAAAPIKPTLTHAQPATRKPALTPAQARQLAQLRADVRRIKVVAAPVAASTAAPVATATRVATADPVVALVAVTGMRVIFTFLPSVPARG